MKNSDEERVTNNVYNLGKKRTVNMVAMAFNRDDVSIKDLAAYAYMQGVVDGWQAAGHFFEDKELKVAAKEK